ncbi:hypothetical protein GF339_06760 [candidate division KSB3 bacterium]|uniref:Uncharacterized protein n=1 Tax=candidate division KSB3 bacterium TaxID=2044937 RepID=A0A9D5Q5I3_9BACT|nr:hypothetical protein [candidate division KSB3 bacterium]MBD3324267.1 hypothetical protein [candidate division KSB3 bacterium]
MYPQQWGVIGIALLLLVVVVGGGCSDDGSDSPTSPLAASTNVTGVWNFAGQLVRNSCELDALSPISGNISLNQSGLTVSTGRVDLIVERGSSWYFYYAGTVTGNNVNMSATDPYVLRDGGTVIHFGSGIDIQNIQNNVGSGSLNITGQCIQGCTGSCQTIWSGTWTKL